MGGILSPYERDGRSSAACCRTGSGRGVFPPRTRMHPGTAVMGGILTILHRLRQVEGSCAFFATAICYSRFRTNQRVAVVHCSVRKAPILLQKLMNYNRVKHKKRPSQNVALTMHPSSPASSRLSPPASP